MSTKLLAFGKGRAGNTPTPINIQVDNEGVDTHSQQLQIPGGTLIDTNLPFCDLVEENPIALVSPAKVTKL